jgi:hypothetical protein
MEAFMAAPVFNNFRLVSGTALSLQLGHRESIDIDLFTAAEYGSIDFNEIDKYLKRSYDYVDTNNKGPIGMGITYFVGHSVDDAIKADIYYNEPFIRPVVEAGHIRMAAKEDIIGMKLDVIARGGRKKDFWDIHMLRDEYSIPAMIQLYQERYPYGHTEREIRDGLIRFFAADEEPNPVCHLGKHWELIKLDFVNWARE